MRFIVWISVAAGALAVTTTAPSCTANACLKVFKQHPAQAKKVCSQQRLHPSATPKLTGAYKKACPNHVASRVSSVCSCLGYKTTTTTTTSPTPTPTDVTSISPSTTYDFTTSASSQFIMNPSFETPAANGSYQAPWTYDNIANVGVLDSASSAVDATDGSYSLLMYLDYFFSTATLTQKIQLNGFQPSDTTFQYAYSFAGVAINNSDSFNLFVSLDNSYISEVFLTPADATGQWITESAQLSNVNDGSVLQFQWIFNPASQSSPVNPNEAWLQLDSITASSSSEGPAPGTVTIQNPSFETESQPQGDGIDGWNVTGPQNGVKYTTYPTAEDGAVQVDFFIYTTDTYSISQALQLGGTCHAAYVVEWYDYYFGGQIQDPSTCPPVAFNVLINGVSIYEHTYQPGNQDSGYIQRQAEFSTGLDNVTLAFAYAVVPGQGDISGNVYSIVIDAVKMRQVTTC